MASSVKGTCYKCDGKGRIDGFGHIHNGVCFACGGTGQLEVKDSGIEQYGPGLTDAERALIAKQRAWVLNTPLERIRQVLSTCTGKQAKAIWDTTCDVGEAMPRDRKRAIKQMYSDILE